MLHSMRHVLVALALSTAGIRADAQHAPVDVDFDPSKGLVFQKDSTFKCIVRFRMQNRFGLLSTSGDDLTPERSDIRVRRFRLRFDGFVLTKRLRYTLHLGFSKSDLDLETNTAAQPIRDAIVHYDLSDHLTVSFGQQKLPGNRQEVISSGSQQFVERSLVNAAFSLDRDFGAWLTWKPVPGDQPLTIKGAITSGEGRNASPGDARLCYTARAEWLPLGAFTNDGDYFEGDLAREPKPKLSIGVAFSNNDGATRSGGQLGKPLYGGRTIQTFIADAVFKYHGWALSSEFAQRATAGSPLTVDPADSSHVIAVYEGWGSCTQLSRMFGAKNEVAARYARVTPMDRQAGAVDREEAWLGYSRYLNGHRIKLQGDLTYGWTNNHTEFQHVGNYWGAFVQVEFGI